MPRTGFTHGIKTLSPASEVVKRGLYAATTLSAVDSDLATGNIKSGETIFGFAGTVVGGGTETIENFAEGIIANNATYTPGSSGIFVVDKASFLVPYFYSSGDTTWYTTRNVAGPQGTFSAVGDGTNFRVKCPGVGPSDYLIMRHYVSSGTYERETDQDLASLATWTPATSGFRSWGAEDGNVRSQIDLPNDGWTNQLVIGGGNEPATVAIGDGADWRIRNGDGANARWIIGMRAVMA